MGAQLALTLQFAHEQITAAAYAAAASDDQRTIRELENAIAHLEAARRTVRGW